MPHTYKEDQLVEQPAIGLFVEPSCVNIQSLHRSSDLLVPMLLSGQVDVCRNNAHPSEDEFVANMEGKLC